MSINLTLIAPPGGGKGTQSEKLTASLKIPHISTGDIFRAIVKGTYKGSFPVQEILGYMNSGKLVPDQIVVGVVQERLAQDDCKKGYLMDGFPRTLPQAEIFDKIEPGLKLNKVILIDVNEENLVKRLTGRRSCPKCGKIYNIHFSAPKTENKCDADGTELVLRSDDNENTVRQRMDVYKKETAPLVDYYRKMGILKTVNGEQSVDAVYQEITEALSR